MLTSAQHKKARSKDSRLSARPFVARSMLGRNGLIARHGDVFLEKELRFLTD
jgi:hypothetical protein